MASKSTSRENDDNFEEDEIVSPAGLAALIEMLSSVFMKIAVLCCSTDPESLYSKEMFRGKFSAGIHRCNRMQVWIVEQKKDYAPNGKSVIAPLKVWYEASKKVS